MLVAVRIGEHDARAVGVRLQDRAERAVELRIHEHEVLAVRDRLQRNARGELDLARRLHDNLDRASLADDGRVVRDGVPARGDRPLEFRGARHPDEVVGAGVAVRLLGGLDRAVANSHDVHAGRGIQGLQDEPPAGEPGAHDADPHGVALRGTALERAVDDDHEGTSSWKSGQEASFSETSGSRIGQSMPKAGSSQRMPSSAPGTYGCETW